MAMRSYHRILRRIHLSGPLRYHNKKYYFLHKSKDKQFVTTDKLIWFSTTSSPATISKVGSSKPNHLVSRYQNLVQSGNVLADEHQLKALTELDRLRNEILVEGPSITTTTTTTTIEQNGWKDYAKFKKFFSELAGSTTAIGVSTTSSPKGVYLHGGVGCGKTFCMDMFYDSLPVKDESKGVLKGVNGKQKVHFHKFMLDVHKQMHEAKMVEGIEGDVLPRVIERTIQHGLLICFDEFQVTDVADALILRRLFTGLFEEGAVVVATSNRPPSDLYLNGIQRDLFLPFIDLLEEKHEVLSMWDSETDYRLVQGENKARGVYFIGNKSKAEFDEAFSSLTKHSLTSSTCLSTHGRKVEVPRASLEYGVARFSFNDLCRQARGAADYILIGDHFHTVFVENVPTLTLNDINVVRRFIVFVDSMYESHVKLIIHAYAAPNRIFEVDLENQHCDEAFAFDRTRSRLEEMGSDEYLKSRWAGSKSQTIQ